MDCFAALAMKMIEFSLNRRFPAGLGDQLEGMQARLMIEHVGHDHQLVGAGLSDQRVDAGPDGSGVPMMVRASICMACAFSIGDQ